MERPKPLAGEGADARIRPVAHPPQYLLTPGPLTTSPETKAAMQRDWGSRDGAFIALNARVLRRLAEIAGVAQTHVAVPIQGSGSFAIEATLGTLIGRAGKALVLVNGAYGRRMVRMLAYAGRETLVLETPEDRPPDPRDVARLLAADPAIGHVAAVHCETTAGILNPIAEIADAVAAAGRSLIVDAMSSFGALELDGAKLQFDAAVASANKCLEGVPGIAFAIVRRSTLAASAGNAPALTLDLHDQHEAMEKTGQWRFTPPTHVLAALDSALDQHAREGGVAGRGARYRENCRTLISGMKKLGFEPLLPEALQAPIIVTFRMPADPNFAFDTFYDALNRRGYVIYPGKLTVAPSFRIGCIGQIDRGVIDGLIDAVRRTLAEMSVAGGRPA